jgi:hypothetical protein
MRVFHEASGNHLKRVENKFPNMAARLAIVVSENPSLSHLLEMLCSPTRRMNITNKAMTSV